MYSPEVQDRIKTLRDKVKVGNATLADYREAVRLLREGREAATAASAKKAATRKSSVPVDVDKLFNDLDNL